MSKTESPLGDLKFHELTFDRWNDFEELFGKRGACGGCWCMWWRLPRSQFQKQKGNQNRQSMKKIVDGGEIPGILAYAGNRPVGWCSVGPRNKYPSLTRSRFLKGILGGKDDESIWSIVCFFIRKEFRNQGLSIKLIQAALRFAKSSGAKTVEGYPKEPKKQRWADAFVWTGHISAFRKAGFVEIDRPPPTRPIMRHFIDRTE